jgi:hypothetical protein
MINLFNEVNIAGLAFVCICSFVLSFAMFLSLFTKNRVLNFLKTFIFPQFNGDVRKDPAAQSFAVICCVQLSADLFIIIISSVFDDMDSLGCIIRSKANGIFVSLLYACCQWFLYVKASRSLVSSDPTFKPTYLRIMQVLTFTIGILYPVTSGITISGQVVQTTGDLACQLTVPLPVFVVALCVDIPLQIFNFLVFYIPLQQHVREFEELEMTQDSAKSIITVNTERSRKGTQTLNSVARKSLWLCVFSILSTQGYFAAGFLSPYSLIGASLATRACTLGFLFCIWLNMKSKWGCEQLSCCSRSKPEGTALDLEKQNRIDKSSGENDNPKTLPLLGAEGYKN